MTKISDLSAMTGAAVDPANDLITMADMSLSGIARNKKMTFAELLLSFADTDGTLAANSDAKVATQKAVKTYVGTAVTGLLDLKGGQDCSANPNYPAASKGDAYIVTVAGKIGGASGTSVGVGDVYFASADNAGGTQAAVGSSWDVIIHSGSLTGALLAANNLSDVSNAGTSRTNLGVGTGDSPQFAGLNIGHATDTTVTRTGAGDIAVEGNALYRAGGTDVPVADGGTGASSAAGARTNLGLAIGSDIPARSPSIQSVASAATVTPTFADDQVNITAQAAGLTLANPTGTAVDGWGIVIRIKDNGTAHSISFGAQYRAIGVTLPTTTVISKTLYLGMVFNNADTKWDVVAVAQEA